MFIKLIAALIIPCFVASSLQPVDAADAASQWEVTDLSFKLDAVDGNPSDVTFSATFENADGGQLETPGFFNGDGEYVIRFTPPTPGEWRYTTMSSEEALAGKTGMLSVQSASEGRKGGILIDPKSPTRFHYQNGETYYPIAFEADWLFALDAEDPQGIPETTKFVNKLADCGFNQVVMNVFAYDVNWKKDARLDPKYDFGSPAVFPFAGDNDHPDHTQLNYDYFKRLDRVIACLDEKGIAAHLMIYVWNKRVNWPDANSEADNRYFDYVVNRYQAYPNLVWDISKEALGYGHTDVNYISSRIQRLRQSDQYNRLITVHDYSYCKRFTDKVDFVSVQLWSSELHSVMRNVVRDMPGKPILNIEHGGYERGPYVVFNGNYTSPEVCLERAYQCVFAGTYPTHYWQGAAWNVLIPDPDALPQEERPRLDYYRHLRTLQERFDLDGLIAGDKKSNAGFSLHDDDRLFLYYVPKECDFFGLRLPKAFRGQTMEVTWFDPFTGEFGKPQKQAISQWPAVTVPEGERFRVLIVKVLPGQR